MSAKAVVNVPQKRALLLHCAGQEVQDVFETLTDPGSAVPVIPPLIDDANEYDIALRTLDAYFVPKVNEPYERHVFRAMMQKEHETVDQFVSRLKNQAQLCNFADADVDIRDQVIDKCRSSKLKRKTSREIRFDSKSGP